MILLSIYFHLNVVYILKVENVFFISAFLWINSAATVTTISLYIKYISVNHPSGRMIITKYTLEKIENKNKHPKVLFIPLLIPSVCSPETQLFPLIQTAHCPLRI